MYNAQEKKMEGKQKQETEQMIVLIMLYGMVEDSKTLKRRNRTRPKKFQAY
jgi:hypothetical protein